MAHGMWDAPSAACADSGAQLLRCASVQQHLGWQAGTADLLPRQGSHLRLKDVQALNEDLTQVHLMEGEAPEFSR